MRETRVRSLGREDPLEKEMATHSSILVWKIPWTEEPGRLRPMGLQRVGHSWATSLSFSLSGVRAQWGAVPWSTALSGDHQRLASPRPAGVGCLSNGPCHGTSPVEGAREVWSPRLSRPRYKAWVLESLRNRGAPCACHCPRWRIALKAQGAGDLADTVLPLTLRLLPSRFSRVRLFVTRGLCPPGSSVHGIVQARILEWATVSSSRGSSPPGDRTWVSWGSWLQADSLLPGSLRFLPWWRRR